MINRHLIRTLKSVNNIKLNIFERIEEWIYYTRFYDKMSTYYYNVKHFLLNVPFFLKQAWMFRTWDYNYNINLFADSLLLTAKNIKEHGHFVGNEKTARRCYTAAEKLRKAYSEHVSSDATISYLYTKNPLSFRCNILTHEQNIPERIFDGMYEAARKRKEKEIKELKEEAWHYLHKYIERFWD